MPFLQWLGAAPGQYLNFVDEDGKFTVEVSNVPDSDAKLRVQVGEKTDPRPRLTKVQVAQLGGVNRDTLVFILLGDGRASVQVLKGKSADDATPEPFLLPDELEEGRTYIEGAAKQVTLNAYERDPRARQACLRHYGTSCSVCDFSFEQVYGEIGEGYIHVHHLKPLSQAGGEYRLDPVNDLRPVCPNCHAMLHQRKTQPYRIEELRDIIEARRRAGGASPRTAGRQ